MSEAQALAFLVIGMQLMTPILWAALGETVCEQAGILNVGIEGVMLLGAFAGALVGVYSGNVVLAVAVAAIVGVLVGCVLAFFYVLRGSDQIVTGLVFNLLAIGLTTTLHERYLGGRIGPTLPRIEVIGLSKIPVLGDVLFRQNALVYMSLVAVPLVWYLMKRTWWGLNIRAVGERPDAAEAGGLDVNRLRFPAVTLASLLTAIGGASLVLGSSGGFVPRITSGRGFIALGVVIVARWNALAVLAVCLLFGVGQALQFLAGQIHVLDAIPTELWIALPYLVTVLVVVLSPGSRYSAALGIPYPARDA